MNKILGIMAGFTFVASHVLRDNDYFIISMVFLVVIAIRAACKVGQFKID